MADLVVSELTCIVDRVARGGPEPSDVVNLDEYLGHLDDPYLLVIPAVNLRLEDYELLC